MHNQSEMLQNNPSKDNQLKIHSQPPIIFTAYCFKQRLSSILQAQPFPLICTKLKCKKHHVASLHPKNTSFKQTAWCANNRGENCKLIGTHYFLFLRKTSHGFLKIVSSSYDLLPPCAEKENYIYNASTLALVCNSTLCKLSTVL